MVFGHRIARLVDSVTLELQGGLEKHVVRWRSCVIGACATRCRRARWGWCTYYGWM